MTGRPGAGLARELTARGVITDPAWHRAVLAVGRGPFVPDTVWVGSKEHPGWNVPVTREDPDHARWVDSDLALVTQVDDGVPAGGDGWGRLPTSSVSQPSLVVAMLQATGAREGDTVLEIGTGTGWNTALLATRLGDEAVTSIEVDTGVAARARATLEGQGFKPFLVTGDGEAGVPERAPFDRVLSTVAVHWVPPAWIEQTRPGGTVVTPWSTWFAPGSLLRLEVLGDGTASGRFLGTAAFMMLRAHRSAHPVDEWSRFVDEDDPAARPGGTRTNPRWIAHRDEGWRLVAGHLVPGVDFASSEAEDSSGEASVFVYDRGTAGGSWALGEYEPDRTEWETLACGPRDLWEEVGRAWDVWRRAGRPGRERLGLTVGADGAQTLWVDTPERVLAP
ncbi:methyltransferase domain-containing protein [Nocardiopsis suaedae]|uniref:Protein-L-isoaspartate O-methyltransferase n=1 Tax=Nocardiopsis suaedae TaxID=3018444 RepID=A0ABT4TJZ7_9ACTN|nr:methyltransferase domain-containing protein [Nocardiopsis suaedae]MDA2804916.1 methyltransferase domain-containing protein [Nocardiopsis suaedae]